MGTLVQGKNNSRCRTPPCPARAVVVLVGFTAVIGQIVLLRELVVIFSGNELSLGLMLASWLVWTAAGSALAGRLTGQCRHVIGWIALLECLCGLSLPTAVWALYWARASLQAVPGELLGPAPTLFISLLDLGLFCSLSGALFVLAALMYQQTCETSERLATSHAYLLESAGSALGGVFTSILLLRFFESFQIALLLTLLNLGMAATLIFRLNRRRIAMVAMATAVLAIPLLFTLAPRLQQSAQQSMWPGFRVLGIRDSIYGKLMITEAGGMRSIYDNGTVLANVPDQAAAEETVHYALLEHPAPENILLIGGGVNGSIAEALKHPTLRRLDYLELDPALIAMYRRFFPAEALRAFADSRVHVHYSDGRLYLKAVHQKFDVIILSLPDPQTAQINRFYTVEFFQSVRDHLAENGVLALQLQSSEDHISPQLGDFLRCIHHTLQQAFPDVAIIPGGTIHFFAAAKPGVVTEYPQTLVSRLQSRHLETQYVREYFLPYRMSPDRMAQIHELLQPAPQTPVNRDFKPVAYYFGIVLWTAQFKSGYARALQDAEHIPYFHIFLGLAALSLLLILLFVLLAKQPGRIRVAALWCVVATGFTLMSLQMLILLTFQSVYGYVYHQLAILIGMFMAGIAAGSYFGISRCRSGREPRPLRTAAINQFVLALSAPLLLLVVSMASHGSGEISISWFAQLIFPALAAACGLPGGFQFAILAEVYIRGRKAKTGTGTLYALDLAGGCVGALLLAGFLIPLFGLWNTAWVTAAISLAPALLALQTGLGSKAISE